MVVSLRNSHWIGLIFLEEVFTSGFTLVWIVQIQIFSPRQFMILNLWPIKEDLCRSLLGGNNSISGSPHSLKEFNILIALCSIKLKICILPNTDIVNYQVNIDRFIICSTMIDSLKLKSNIFLSITMLLL